MKDKRTRLGLMAVLLISACVTDPSGNQIEEWVASENARRTGETVIGQKPAKSVSSREERLKQLVGKEFTAYIHNMRGRRGLALVQNVEVYVDDCEIGDKVKLRIGTSRTGVGIGDVVQRLGNVRRQPQADGVAERQIYLIEIIGRTPAGDYYGLIGDRKAYVLGARKIGEIVRAVVMGTDTIEGDEELIYMKKLKEKG